MRTVPEVVGRAGFFSLTWPNHSDDHFGAPTLPYPSYKLYLNNTNPCEVGIEMSILKPRRIG